MVFIPANSEVSKWITSRVLKVELDKIKFKYELVLNNSICEKSHWVGLHNGDLQAAREQISWPPRSPDFTFLDFLLTNYTDC